jgi:translation elongation factor EF-Tu-like GTPase
MSTTAPVDHRDGTGSGVLNVRALISFLVSHEGGRKTDVRLTYRPLHNFGDPDNREMWFGQICLDAMDKISPGESREVVVQFDPDPALVAQLKPGRTWRIQEGAQLVATAKVIEVLGRK